MVFIGDLYQLPPVVTSAEKELFQSYYESPYFFSARVFEQFDMEFVELEKIYRQKDDVFIGLLNSIRNRSFSQDDLMALNTRFSPDFTPSADDFYITLASTNALVDAENEKKLAELPGEAWRSEAEIF